MKNFENFRRKSKICLKNLSYSVIMLAHKAVGKSPSKPAYFFGRSPMLLGKVLKSGAI